MKMHLTKKPVEWRVLKKVPYEFLDEDDKERDIKDLTEAEIQKVTYNNRAINTIMNGLSTSKSDKVSSCKSAKEIWTALEQYHERTSVLRKVKLGQLMNEYGRFMVKEGEIIRESQARF